MPFNRDAWEGKAPLTMPAPRIPLDVVRPGMRVWTDMEKKRSAHDEPLGGIVLGVVHRGRWTDDDGEIHPGVRAFRCYDPIVKFEDAFSWFAEADFSQDGVEVADNNSLQIAIRRFCGQIARRKGLLTASEGQLIADAHRLTAVLMGGR